MGIEHRKVGKILEFVDERGKPMSDRRICIRQKNHAFLFGCGGFVFIPYVMNNDEKQKQPTDSWLEVFNYATLPFYWGNFEPEEGKTDHDTLMKTAEYLKEKGVKVKGHPLCWHTECAKWLMNYDNETILKKQLDRIEREVKGFAGTIDMWDVINEVVIMPIYDRYDNAITRICKDLGRVGLVREVFARAHESNPDAVLLINDFNTTADYEKLIEGCLDANVPISAIGIQSHQHQGYWGREKLENVLERFSRFSLPIHFTENTLISGELMPPHIVDLNDWQVEKWPSTPEGEERQARETEEMYRLLFAHPLVEAITAWDFKDGRWLNAPSGYVRDDNSLKPSYKMLKDLIKKEWWTDITVMTDENGKAKAEAFKGEYEIESDGLCAVADLIDNNEQTIVLTRK